METSSEEQEDSQVRVGVCNLINGHELPNLMRVVLVKVEIPIDCLVCVLLAYPDEVVRALTLCHVSQLLEELFLQILAGGLSDLHFQSRLLNSLALLSLVAERD